MSSFKQFKSPKLSIVLQVTETTEPTVDGRLWEVHDVERGRGFRVSLTSRDKGKQLTDAQIEDAIGRAIEEALVSPPEKLPGSTYDLTLTQAHLGGRAKP